NYWLICPRGYLLDGYGRICPGPGDGSACASCVASPDTDGHRRRLTEIRSRAHAGLTSVLAVSDAVRRTLLGSGYAPELVDVVRQAMPHDSAIWEQVGRDRRPGRQGETLTVAFLGSAYPHKGPQLLVQAAQLTQAKLDIRILGEIPDAFAAHLRALDRRRVVTLGGAFAPHQIGELLRNVDVVTLPSMWWDCAPLAAAECLAARTPLVVPRLAGLAEAVRDGIDGLVFNALDAGDLARVLDRLALGDGLLERLQAGIAPPRAFTDYVDQLEEYYSGGRPGRVREELDAASVAVCWKGDHGQSTSLSIVNDNVTARLPGPVQRVASADRAPADPPLPHAAAVEVRHQWPPDLTVPPSGALAVIVPWEFGAVPRDWLEAMHRNADELWVPSEYVRQMYVAGGLPADRVHAIANGVDLDLFTADGPVRTLPESVSDETRFLFVGGLIWRKGPDILLEAFKRAFPGRADVTLVIKDFGADSVYRDADRTVFREWADSGSLPRIELLGGDLPAAELAALYRSCDVLVHPYRGEGFGMPVLEAMACGLPVIVTGGGPTDEFCPPEAGWRIASTRSYFPSDRIGTFLTEGRPWVLEPDLEHLTELLQLAQADPVQRRARGRAGRSAAAGLTWDAVAAHYASRITVLAARRPLHSRACDAPFPFSEDVQVRLLATPAWRGHDRLSELLREWCDATTAATSACLYLLADPTIAGSPEELEAFVVAAAERSGADLEGCADINVLMEPAQAGRDERLHASVDAYAPLHPACSGHLRLAAQARRPVCALGTGDVKRLVTARVQDHP
ncbi:MAG TPA: glycosyltransferase, partial [Solirubrobacteraceae bacterium]